MRKIFYILIIILLLASCNETIQNPGQTQKPNNPQVVNDFKTLILNQMKQSQAFIAIEGEQIVKNLETIKKDNLVDLSAVPEGTMVFFKLFPYGNENGELISYCSEINFYLDSYEFTEIEQVIDNKVVINKVTGKDNANYELFKSIANKLKEAYKPNCKFNGELQLNWIIRGDLNLIASIKIPHNFQRPSFYLFAESNIDKKYHQVSADVETGPTGTIWQTNFNDYQINNTNNGQLVLDEIAQYAFDQFKASTLAPQLPTHPTDSLNSNELINYVFNKEIDKLPLISGTLVERVVTLQKGEFESMLKQDGEPDQYTIPIEKVIGKIYHIENTDIYFYSFDFLSADGKLLINHKDGMNYSHTSYTYETNMRVTNSYDFTAFYKGDFTNPRPVKYCNNKDALLILANNESFIATAISDDTNSNFAIQYYSQYDNSSLQINSVTLYLNGEKYIPHRYISFDNSQQQLINEILSKKFSNI